MPTTAAVAIRPVASASTPFAWDTDEKYRALVAEVTANTGSPVLLGSVLGSGDEIYNGAVLVAPEGKGQNSRGLYAFAHGHAAVAPDALAAVPNDGGRGGVHRGLFAFLCQSEPDLAQPHLLGYLLQVAVAVAHADIAFGGVI